MFQDVEDSDLGKFKWKHFFITELKKNAVYILLNSITILAIISIL